MRITGSPCVDRPVLPRGTYRGPHVAGISHPCPSKHDKGCPTRRHTPQHKSTRKCTYANRLPPIYPRFLRPAQSYKPISLLDWNRKDPKLRKHGVAVFGQAHVRTRGVEGPPGRSLAGKKLFWYMVFSKTTACSSYVQPWLVAVGGWRLVEIAGWRLAVGGWWLAAVGGSWRQLAVGDGWLVAVGSG